VRIDFMVRVAILGGCVLLMSSCTTGIPVPSVTSLPLDNEQKSSLENWLSQHPGYRIATEVDCDCAEDIRQMRTSGSWGEPIPDYEPFLLKADFNKDGQSDFATLAIDDQSKGVMLLIFNGAFDQSNQPAYAQRLDQSDVKHIGLFLTHKDHWPILGPFESEGCIYRPKGTTYEEDCGNF
jgi:hypothetical protein